MAIDWTRPYGRANWFDLENKKMAIEVRRQSMPAGISIIGHELNDEGRGTGRQFEIAFFPETYKTEGNKP